MSTEAPTTVDKVKESAKAYAGLIGAIVTGLLAAGINQPYGYWLALVGAVATGVSVWATKNAETPEQAAVRKAGEQALLPDDPYAEGYANEVANRDAIPAVYNDAEAATAEPGTKFVVDTDGTVTDVATGAEPR